MHDDVPPEALSMSARLLGHPVVMTAASIAVGLAAGVGVGAALHA